MIYISTYLLCIIIYCIYFLQHRFFFFNPISMYYYFLDIFLYCYIFYTVFSFHFSTDPQTSLFRTRCICLNPWSITHLRWLWRNISLMELLKRHTCHTFRRDLQRSRPSAVVGEEDQHGLFAMMVVMAWWETHGFQVHQKTC